MQRLSKKMIATAVFFLSVGLHTNAAIAPADTTSSSSSMARMATARPTEDVKLQGVVTFVVITCFFCTFTVLNGVINYSLLTTQLFAERLKNKHSYEYIYFISPH